MRAAPVSGTGVGLRLRRWRWARRGNIAAPLAELWAVPSPRGNERIDDTNFLVCDAEMSGLDPNVAELLSLGWVRVSAGEIRLGSAEHHPIRNAESVGQSAVVHHLRDCELAGAPDLQAALMALLHACKGCTLVFHHARLDLAFLNRALIHRMGAPLLLPVVDTLRQEQRLQSRQGRTLAHGDLRLQACRDRYGLPSHAAHNALSDALATAELLIAHIRRRGPGLRLRDLL